MNQSPDEAKSALEQALASAERRWDRLQSEQLRLKEEIDKLTAHRKKVLAKQAVLSEEMKSVKRSFERWDRAVGESL